MTQPTPSTDTGTRFAPHYVEMIVAMVVGMFALDLLWSALGIHFSFVRYPELAYLLLAFDMSVGMAAWMRVRGHAWAPALKMCGALFAPVVPLFPLLWLGAIDGVDLTIVAMFPLMLVAMLRRRDE